MANMARIVWHGSGLGEEWAVTTTHQLDGALSEDNCNAIAAALAAEVPTANKTARLAMIYSDQAYDLVSVYYYATTPNDPASVVAHAAITGFVGAGTGQQSLQQAMCVTTLTGYSGASNRGRMYLPAAGYNLTGHRFTSGQTDQGALVAQSFIQDNFNTIMLHSPVTQGTAVVFSAKLGTGRAIKYVSADNRPDTQRRRAASLTSTYAKLLTVTTD